MDPDKRPLVHFGDAEDILSTCFLRDEEEFPEKVPTEEERKAEEIQNRIQQALKSDDVSMFKHLLVEIPDLLQKYADKPILHLAAEHGALKVLQEFVSKPADSINWATSDYEATTPLFWAIKCGQADMVNWLLSNGAFHQPLNVYQDGAVYVAVRYNQYDLLPLLNEHNCDFNRPNGEGDLPILHAVRDGDVECLDKLLECGVDVHAKSASGMTVMHAVLACVYDKRLCMLQRLYKAGYNQPTQHILISVLLPALKVDDLPFLSSMIWHVTAIDSQQEMQEVAVEWSSLKCLQFLIKEHGFLLSMGFIVRHGDSRVLALVMRHSTSQEAIEEGLSLVYECIQQCWKVGGYKARTKGQLHHAMHIETEHKVQILLDNGIDIYQRGHDTQMSPLFFATKISMVCVVFWMLRAGVDPKRIPDNRTPLAAALNGMFAYFLNINMIKVTYLWINYLPSLNDPAVDLYLKKTQHLETAVNLSPEMKTVINELRCLLINKSSNPNKLSHLCRIAVLRSLKLNAHKKVHQLPLPTRLKEYILLQDLEDLCYDINRRVHQNNLTPSHNGRALEETSGTESAVPSSLTSPSEGPKTIKRRPTLPATLLCFMQSPEQVQDLLSYCVLSEDLAFLQVLEKYDRRNNLILAAIRECRCGKFFTLEYLAKKGHFSIYSTNNPFREIVIQCFTSSAVVSTYPFLRWESLAHVTSRNRGQILHNYFRKGLWILVQNGLEINTMIVAKLSPFMQAASHTLICLLLDFLRYGCGIYIYRKLDVVKMENLVYTAISHTYRSSGLRRKFLRSAFILCSFCKSIPRSVARLCAQETVNDPHRQPETLRECTRQLIDLILYRSKNVCSLQHLCRLTIIQHYKPQFLRHGHPNLHIPTQLREYIALSDLQSQDRAVCLMAGNTAMDLAIQLMGRKKIISKLVEAGYPVNNLERPNKNVLRNAVYYNNTAAVQVLMPYVTNDEILEKAANLAVSNADLSTLSFLMEIKPNVDINLALRTDKQHILKYLLDQGIRVDNKPVLFWCVYYCTMVTRTVAATTCQRWQFMQQREERLFELHQAHSDMIQTLLEYGAGVDFRYADTGSTPLRQCATGGLVCLTLSLLKAGSNPSIPDENGTTALQIALQDCCNPYVSVQKRKLLTSIASILIEYIPYFTNEPSVLELLQTARDKPSTLPHELYQSLLWNSSSPRPLQHLCRHSIIQNLKPRPHTKVSQLGLPHRLQNYLLLEDLVEMNREAALKFRLREEHFCFFHREMDPVLEKYPSLKSCQCDPLGVIFACKF